MTTDTSQLKSTVRRLRGTGILGQCLGIAVSFTLLLLVLRGVRLADVVQAVRGANFAYCVPVAVFFVSNLILRALRWRTLFQLVRTPSWASLFIAMMIGYLGNNVLPGRAGELVRVYVIGQRESVSKSAALATVVVERVVDLTVVVSLLAIVLSAYPLPEWAGRAGAAVAVLSIGALSCLVLFVLTGQRVLDWMLRVLRFLPTPLLDQIAVVGNGLVAGVSGMRVGRRMVQFLLLTAAIWCMEVTNAYLMAQALHVPIAIGGALFVILVTGIGLAVPSAPGYIGTYEFFATSSLGLLGVEPTLSLSFALVMHTVTFLGTSVLGAACLVVNTFHGKARP